jgi:hypothetical protein
MEVQQTQRFLAVQWLAVGRRRKSPSLISRNCRERTKTDRFPTIVVVAEARVAVEGEAEVAGVKHL